ncbi:MAG: gamma-glutamylcyclotransferase [Negativicutes bacterium]|nr:gamma-glutamylcyclotransferase [Negativicutes bacterium]
MCKYYIAYGSNLNINQMKRRCPTAKVVGTGFIEDYELLFKGSKTGGYLTIKKAEGKSLPVAIWKVTELDEQALDRYEGYPTFYYKTDVEINIKGIKTGKEYRKKAFVYIMHEDRDVGMPSKYYVMTCLEGYKTFGFSPKYLEDALLKSMEVNNENNN